MRFVACDKHRVLPVLVLLLLLLRRPAGESEIDGAVSICVPSWVPQPDSVGAAAAALQATAADQQMPSTTCAPWQTLYFVSVMLETPQEVRIRQLLPGLAASSCGSFSIEQGRRGVGDARVNGSAAATGSGVVLSVPAAGQVHAGAARCVYDDSNLMLLSSMSEHSYNVSSSNSSGSNALAQSSTLDSRSSSHAASLVGSCVTSIAGGTAAAVARAVCRRIEGLQVGGLIASGSYGRVYRGHYYGSTVSCVYSDYGSPLSLCSSSDYGSAVTEIPSQQLRFNMSTQTAGLGSQ